MHVLFACNHAKVPLQTSCDPSSPCGSVSSLFHSSPIINKNCPKRPVLSDSEDGIGSSDGVENGDGEMKIWLSLTVVMVLLLLCQLHPARRYHKCGCACVLEYMYNTTIVIIKDFLKNYKD